jgi:hypothetical protein
MMDIVKIIGKGHNLLEMYILTNSILYKLGLSFNSESITKRFIYFGIMFFNLVIIGYNNYNGKIINPIFSVIEQILFGTTNFTKAMTKDNNKSSPNTFTEIYDKYAFAIFPIMITMILMKVLDCGVMPLKDRLPYITIPVPFIGVILTPLINKIIRMTDNEFFLIYTLVRFIIYFFFQLPIRVNIEGQKLAESISKLNPTIKSILNVFKIIYYIINPFALIINRIDKNNAKVVGRTFSTILSIVSLVTIALYYNDHKSMKYLTLLENKLCDGIDNEQFFQDNVGEEYYDDNY